MVNLQRIGLGLLLVAGSAMAQGNEPDAAAKPVYIGRVVVASTLLGSGVATAESEARKDWETLTYADLANITDAAFAVRLNGALEVAREDGAKSDELLLLQRAADAGAVLRKGKKGWELIHDERGEVTLLGQAKRELPAGAALRAILGYDAVVIAQKERIVYAQTPDLGSRTQLYAVALGASAASAVVKDDAKKVRAALLRLIDTRKVPGHGHISRFRLVSSEKAEDLVFGTKLRIESWR